MVVDFLESFQLRLVLGHYPFPRVAVWDVVGSAEVVHHLLALDAEVGFERVLAVVETGVDDLRGVFF